jgi:crotonobetainyl-CoA:carnitine CoA-transferase CaiB-like acyl-CoA transferase
VADKLGAGEARLRALNPKLIYCSISGFGATARPASRPAYDTVAQAASGFLNLLVNPKNPRVVGPAIADALTGYYAAYGVLGALFERGRTGHGRRSRCRCWRRWRTSTSTPSPTSSRPTR